MSKSKTKQSGFAAIRAAARQQIEPLCIELGAALDAQAEKLDRELDDIHPAFRYKDFYSFQRDNPIGTQFWVDSVSFRRMLNERSRTDHQRRNATHEQQDLALKVLDAAGEAVESSIEGLRAGESRFAETWNLDCGGFYGRRIEDRLLSEVESARSGLEGRLQNFGAAQPAHVEAVANLFADNPREGYKPKHTLRRTPITAASAPAQSGITPLSGSF